MFGLTSAGEAALIAGLFSLVVLAITQVMAVRTAAKLKAERERQDRDKEREAHERTGARAQADEPSIIERWQRDYKTLKDEMDKLEDELTEVRRELRAVKEMLQQLLDSVKRNCNYEQAQKIFVDAKLDEEGLAISKRVTKGN